MALAAATAALAAMTPIPAFPDVVALAPSAPSLTGPSLGTSLVPSPRWSATTRDVVP